MEKEVIYVGQKQNSKPIEITHHLNRSKGWVKTDFVPDCHRVLHLGYDCDEGDIFAVYYAIDDIHIFKGHLNSGKY